MDNPNDIGQPTDANPATPATPAAPTTPSPAPAAPMAPTASPVAPAPPVAQNTPMVKPVSGAPMHSRIFDGILKTLSGGPVKVQMPDGSVREVPQTKSSMAKSILAGALTGMFSGGDIYSKGAGGADRIDPAKVMSEGFQAGQNFRKGETAEAQRAIDDAQSRKMKNFDNNQKIFQQSLAMYGMRHANLDPVVKANQEGVLSAATEFDKTRPEGEPSIFVKQGLSGPEVMNQFKPDGTGYNLSDSNVILEGTRDVPDGKGGYAPEPIYSIIRPDAKLKLTEDQAKALAKYYPQMENAWDLTKGNINFKSGQFVAMQHDINSLIHTEGTLKSLAADMGSSNEIDLAAAFRKNPSDVLRSVNSIEQVMAANAQKGEQTSDDQIIDAIARSGGRQMLGLLGSNEDVANYRNQVEAERIHKLKMAAMVGVNKQGVLNARMVLSNPASTDEEKQNAQSVIAAWTAQTKAESAMKTDAKNAPLKELVPKVASNIINGDLTDLQSVAGRGDLAKGMLQTEIHDQAVAHGLDPAEYSPAKLKAKVAKMQDYTAMKTSQNIKTFDQFLGHSSELYDATQELSRSNSPMLNMAMNKISDKAWSTPELAKFRVALGNVREEYQNFLAAGFSPKEINAEEWKKILTDDASPATVLAAATSMVHAAGKRLSAMGTSYLSDMGTTFPTLLSQNGQTAMKRYGLNETNSDIFTLSTPLPKGNNEVLTDPTIIGAFKRAAQGDSARAVRYARMNGWYVPEKMKDGTVKYGPPENPPQAAPQE